MQRSITGALFVLVVTACVYWNVNTALCLFAVVTMVAVYEYLQLTGKITGNEKINYGAWLLLVWPYLACLFMIISNVERPWLITSLIFIPLALMGLALFERGNEKTFSRMGLWLGALVFVVMPFLITMFLILSSSYENYDWRYIFSILTLVWANDTMAYVTGRLMGKTKLAPAISPGKTVEGFIGGIVFAGITGIIWAYVFDGLYVYWVLAGMAVGIAATIGDLAESLLKRTAGVKDSGTIFPGHGGMLDRFDGFMTAVPVMLFFRILGLI